MEKIRASLNLGIAQRNLSAVQVTEEMQVQSLGQEDPPEEEMATHSRILAWEISWTGKPGRLQSKGSQSRTQPSDYTTSR